MTFLTYVYLLRVPLLTWGLLASLPWLAIPSDAALGSLLRGLFDLPDAPGTGGMLARMLGAWTFALVTVTALMAAAAIAITARLIVLDAHDRFGTAPPATLPGIELLFRLLPLLAAAGVIGGAWVQSYGTVGFWSALLGILIGLGIFAFVMRPVHDWLWDQVFGLRPPAALAVVVVPAARRVFESFRAFVRRTPEGFVLPATGRIRARHAFALFQLLFTLLLYALLFAISAIKVSIIGWTHTNLPTMCVVLLLATLVCWTLSAMSFVLDRFRVPVLAPLIAYGWLVSAFPQGDHFFPSLPRTAQDGQKIGPAQVLAERAGRPAIVVAATGGGIQAAAWSARVLAGLQHDAVACGDDFDKALVAISAVSGGSVGAMFIADAYDRGHLPPMSDIDAEPAVKAAEASSLDNVAWALAYPDLVWTVAPFLKGLWLWPFHLVNGPLLTVDRGTALEDAWKRTPTLAAATLDDWRRDLVAMQRPAVIFNSTIVETGERMVFGTTALDKAKAAGRVDLGTDERYVDADVHVVTAARMSATFPYVSPPARIQRHGVFDDQYHMVDGGYYDNYGTATLVEWLDQGLHAAAASKPTRILIIEIRSFPTGDPRPPDGRRGWWFETAHPATTLYAVRGAGQLSHSIEDVDLTQKVHPEVTSLVIEFPARVADEADDVAPPLSWHLTPGDRGRLRAAWTLPSNLTVRKAVHNFLSHAHVDDSTDIVAPCIQ
jgi:hypothetical protein